MLDDDENETIVYRVALGDGRALTCLSRGIGVPRDASAPAALTTLWSGASTTRTLFPELADANDWGPA